MEEKKLYIYTWYEFLPQSAVEKFEKETGIKVVLDYYDSNETLEAQLLTKNSGYDIVFPTAWPYLARQIKSGLYQELDKSKLTNLSHLDKDILELLEKADPGLKYAVPYFWGLTGIGYNIDEIQKIMPDAPVDSWAILFDPKLVSKFSACGVYLLDDALDVFSAALVYLGLPSDSNNPDHLKQAYDLLLTIRPYIRRFDTYRAMTDLANGEACVAQNWSGDIAISRQRAREAQKGVRIGFAIPKEGTAFWVDSMVIPIDAPNPENAHKFINFILRPEVIADITNELEYANANIDSLPYVDEKLKHDSVVYPPKKYLKSAYTSTAQSREHERRLNRLMMQLKLRRE